MLSEPHKLFKLIWLKKKCWNIYRAFSSSSWDSCGSYSQESEYSGSSN